MLLKIANNNYTNVISMIGILRWSEICELTTACDL